MNNIKYAMHLVRRACLQPRTVLIFCMLAVYVSPCLADGYAAIGQYGVRLNLWGQFACVMSNEQVMLMCFAGYLMLLSDLPFWSRGSMYEAMRVTPMRATLVRIAAVLALTALYLIGLLAMVCLLGGCFDFSFHQWDKMSFSAARQQLGDAFVMIVPQEIVLDYTPWAAFSIAMRQIALVFTGMGCLLLFCLLAMPMKKAVFAAFALWGGLDIAVDWMGLGYRMYAFSPVSWARMTIVIGKAYNDYYPSWQWCTAGAAILCLAALLLLVCLPNKRQWYRRPLNR